jgi:hypothetical protein
MSVTVTGANELYKNINRLAQWSVRDSAKLQAVGERVGDVYANYLKANVKDLDKDIKVKNKGKIYKVKKGQLRRSSGTWQPDKKRNTILAGPRTKAIGKRGKTKKYDDGWFAHIVEKGDFAERFGGKHRTQNTGVFSRGIRSTKNRSEKLQIILLKRNFANYANRL